MAGNRGGTTICSYLHRSRMTVRAAENMLANKSNAEHDGGRCNILAR